MTETSRLTSLLPRLAIMALLTFIPIDRATAQSDQKPALKQATIKGLLVVELGDGSVAGAVSQMNATVVRGQSGEFALNFNQDVGGMMAQATAEVKKFMEVRHGDKIPWGSRIELAFADKYSPKDGPSAAVVCALLTESIITGAEIDQGFAATGDMTATGAIRRIGGLSGKVRGAVKKGCTLLGAPKDNTQSINDMYINEGISSLIAVQVFSLATFEEARAVAMSERSEEIQTAIDEFASVQKVLSRDEKLVRNGKVLGKLKRIVQLAPNHQSARLLYLHGVGKGPSQLSLPGSLTAIEEAAGTFGTIIEDGSFEVDSGHDDVLRDLVLDINRLRPKLDRRTRPYCDSYENFASFIKEIRSRRFLKPSEITQIKSMVKSIESKRNKLLNNKEVREELMLE